MTVFVMPLFVVLFFHMQHCIVWNLIIFQVLLLKAVGDVESTHATSCREIEGFAVINRLRLPSEESAETLEISHRNRVINHVDNAANSAVRVHESRWAAHNLYLLQVRQ